MNPKKLTPKHPNPVTRKTSISLPELHEEQLTDGLGERGAIAQNFLTLNAMCSYDGDDA